MLISKRSDRVCNFLEDVGAWSKDTKLVYRVYATLYFIFVVDGSESELGICSFTAPLPHQPPSILQSLPLPPLPLTPHIPFR